MLKFTIFEETLSSLSRSENGFTVALAKSALAVLNTKVSEGCLTRWHKISCFLHPLKRRFVGMNLDEDTKESVLPP